MPKLEDKVAVLEEAYGSMLLSIRSLEDRMKNVELAIQKTLELSIKKESTVELTVASLLQESFGSLSNHLKSSVNQAKHELMVAHTGLSVAVVDGVDELPNDNSITVIKTETGYEFKDIHGKTNTHASLGQLNEYFDKRPKLFEVDSQIVVNIYHKGTK